MAEKQVAPSLGVNQTATMYFDAQAVRRQIVRDQEFVSRIFERENWPVRFESLTAQQQLATCKRWVDDEALIRMRVDSLAGKIKNKIAPVAPKAPRGL